MLDTLPGHSEVEEWVKLIRACPINLHGTMGLITKDASIAKNTFGMGQLFAADLLHGFDPEAANGLRMKEMDQFRGASALSRVSGFARDAMSPDRLLQKNFPNRPAESGADQRPITREEVQRTLEQSRTDEQRGAKAKAKREAEAAKKARETQIEYELAVGRNHSASRNHLTVQLESRYATHGIMDAY